MEKQEPIVAYRLWYFYDEKLHSAFVYNLAWKSGEAIKSEVNGYTQGIHAWKAFPDALLYGNYCDSTKWKKSTIPVYPMNLHGTSFINIYGEVYLWGQIIEHEKGYRAEFAYPK